MNLELIILLVIVVAILLVATYLWFTGKKEQAKKLIYELVLRAEARYIDQSGQGHLKFKMVIDNLYAELPSTIKIFITEEMITDWIEEAVQLLKSITD